MKLAKSLTVLIEGYSDSLDGAIKIYHDIIKETA